MENPDVKPVRAAKLSLYLGETDKFGHRPVYEVVVEKAREAGLAGATVIRGPMGYGRSTHLHTAKILQLSTDLPLVLELVDEEAKLRNFLPAIREVIGGSLATLEPVEVVNYDLADRRSR